MSRNKKKIIKVLLIVLISIIVSSCGEKSYQENDNITVSGKIKTVTNGEKVKNVLDLDKAILINDQEITELEIDYEKEIKKDYEVTVSGTVNGNNTIKVKEIEDDKALVNKYSNDDFSFVIPVSIIKKCTVKKIENGFTVYSNSEMTTESEVFTLLSTSYKEFNNLEKDPNVYIERIDSNKEKVIIIKYPTVSEISKNDLQNYEAIGNSINTIKKSVKIK